MADLAVVGVIGTASAGAVGVAAVVRNGSRHVVASLRANWPVALTLGLSAAALLGGLTGAIGGDLVDGAAIGVAGFTVGFVHGLDL
jgi:hypothetical protein